MLLDAYSACADALWCRLRSVTDDDTAVTYCTCACLTLH
jgi:hypothetical protein